MAHTVIPPPRGTTATLELAHKGNINDKTIPERDREVRDFNATLLASAITRYRHLVIDTHRTDLGVCVALFLLNQYWGIVMVPGSFLKAGDLG